MLKSFTFRIAVILVCMLSAAPCSASEAEVRASVNEFLTALHNLDLARIQDCFADRLSVFQHGGEITRLDSKDALEKAQEQTFAFIKGVAAKEGRTSAPYHDVGARDLRIQLLSENAAIASFMMPNPTFVRRASLVYSKREGNWKIVHMHTSTRNVPK